MPEDVQVILKVDMHCKGCRTKVRKCLLGFPGVECLEMDMKEQKVTIKGKFDAMKIYETVKRKSGKKTLLLSPLPLAIQDKKEPQPKIKEEAPEVTAVFKVKMHCEGCAKEVQKAILGMGGELDVKVDALQQKVVVKGKGFDPRTICSTVARKTGKLMVYVPPPKAQQKEENKKDSNKEEKKKEENKEKKKKEENQEEIKKKEENQEDIKKKEESQEEKKEEKKEEEKKEEQKEEKREEKKEEEKEKKKDEEKVEEKKEGGNPKPQEEEEKKELEATKGEEMGDEGPIIVRMDELSGPKKYEYIPSRSLVHEYAYPPQLFSDENPNACSIM